MLWQHTRVSRHTGCEALQYTTVYRTQIKPISMSTARPKKPGPTYNSNEMLNSFPYASASNNVIR